MNMINVIDLQRIRLRAVSKIADTNVVSTPVAGEFSHEVIASRLDRTGRLRLLPATDPRRKGGGGRHVA